MTKRLSSEAVVVPRNELRGLGDEPRSYYIWFSTKQRKWLLLGEVEAEVRDLLRRIATDKRIALLECETMVDHVHLILLARPDQLSREVKLLKGVSARRLFQKFPSLKLDGRTEHFWQRGFGFRELGDDAEGVAWYIRTQKRRPDAYGR